MKTIAFVSPFSNDPFAIVAQAYKNLYNKPFLAYYDQHKDTDHDKEYGFTTFQDGKTQVITIFAEHPVNVCVETLAHELAHVAVGVEHEHDAVWEEAFDKIFAEYNRLGEEIFGERGEAADNGV